MVIKMKEEYSFRFRVQKVEGSGDEYNSLVVFVFARMFNNKKDLVQEGLFRVKFNSIGIYPVPHDVAKQITSKHIQRLLIVELKRYIKPQRKFLTPGIYKPVW
ncbi:hypothetical protein [Rossellomorea aquimaris]|uniref:hypothetical protein n=1 Tax=Rossellomorea aquimaris TaxID=189382 RepID=UPI0007D0676A|nr:hypothetical protein [Rossellomorea aquimaris]